MDREKFQNRYRISSARAHWHAYDDGAYFVTICTGHREHYFGEISEGKMQLTAVGKYVANILQTISAHCPYAEIPSFVIMPNHLHAIVLIDGNKIPSTRRDVIDNNNENTPRRDAACHNITRRDAACHNITRRDAACHNITRRDAACHNITCRDAACHDITRRDAACHVSTKPTENDITGKNEKMREIANQSGWLSVCIGGIKSAVTKYAHQNNIDFEWQTRFHDHIIQDSMEMSRIAEYIQNNVAQWE